MKPTAAGSPVALTWGEVGPTATQAGWDDYRHDGASSASWTMTGAPRGSVNSSVLSRLLAPHGDIDRKRVSLLYRPMDLARAAAVVERDQNNAHMRVLLDKEGPFKKCAYDGHKTPTSEKAALPHVMPEAGIFD